MNDKWIDAAQALPDLDRPVLAMLPDNPHIWAMMLVQEDDGRLWAIHTGLSLDDPDSYEFDDNYLVVRWMYMPTFQQEIL